MPNVRPTYGLDDLPKLSREQLDRAAAEAATHALFLSPDESAVVIAFAHGMRGTTVAASGTFSYGQVRQIIHHAVKDNGAKTANQLLFWLGVQEGERRARAT